MSRGSVTRTGISGSASIPCHFLKTEHTSPTFFADEFPSDEKKVEDYVLKPLYSFAGHGVDMAPTREKIAGLQNPHEWILQRKVDTPRLCRRSTVTNRRRRSG